MDRRPRPGKYRQSPKRLAIVVSLSTCVRACVCVVLQYNSVLQKSIDDDVDDDDNNNNNNNNDAYHHHT